MPNELPEYERPPLDEVVIGIQFDPLDKFREAHFGLFWPRIRDRYPSSEDQPQLPQQIESNDLQPTNSFLIGMAPVSSRSWFLSAEKNEIIQIQKDHFWRNWRKLSGDEAYPRFPHIIRELKHDWDIFCRFVADENLGTINVNQCDLTYINHIEKGAAWSDFSGLNRLFTLIRPSEPAGFLPSPEMLSWAVKYKLPEGRGRLHVTMNPVFRPRDFQIVLGLELAARGTPPGKSDEQVFSWFDLAHEWIVKGFTELTQPTMHELWGKKM